MTSRVSFYKAMIQDLRHRIWMIALSCLASFMALPVFYLLQQQSWDRNINRWIENAVYEMDFIQSRKIELVYEFFEGYMLITCGIVLGVGALIVGIWGFRHVFSKKMIDLYHSIPVDRKQLFFVSYVNGFLIWFVPMVIGVALTAVMALVFLGSFTVWMGLILAILKSVSCMVLSFLLIYHLAIVAVMLSGNILNTLVNGTILNFSAIALYGLLEVFAGSYFSTYYSFFEEKILEILWTSPISSAIYQLVMCHEKWNMSVFVMNMVMVVLLFASAFILYMRRPSELAEQGMKIKWVQVLFKSVVTVIAGLAGWLFFGYLTEINSLAWTVFGSVFAGILVYGILDIIFHMDFKAFFKHKIQMAVTTVAAILIGCAFLFDWIGFDTYMPDKENIANMGIYVNGFGYNNYGNYIYDGIMTTESRINRMQFEDEEAIHAFLEAMTDRVSGKNLNTPEEGRNTSATVRVTEKSGKTYYRSYRVWNTDEDVLVPILMDESYVQANMIVPKVFIEDIEILPLDSDYHIEVENGVYAQSISNEEHAKELLYAYNKDISMKPELAVYQKEDMIGQLQFRHYGESYFNIYLDLYEGMEHVVSVLEKYDYSLVLDEIDPQKVTSIQVLAYGDGISSLEEIFGLKEKTSDMQSGKEQAFSEPVVIAQTYLPTEEKAVIMEGEYSARFTDKEDIAKLLEAVSVVTPHNPNLFGKKYCSAEIRINFNDLQNNIHVSMENGKMPKELLTKFEKGSQHMY